MSGKSNIATIGLIVVALLAAAALYIELKPRGSSSAAGPQLVGQMKYFAPAKTLLARPDITWNDAGGRNITLADFEGKTILLNFWATWCAPCIRELPSLNRLQKKLGSDKFAVIALNIDRSGKPAAVPMAKRLKLDALELYLDPSLESSQTLGVQAMPTTYLFDRNGNVLGVFRGAAEWDSQESIDLINYFVERPDYAQSLNQVGG